MKSRDGSSGKNGRIQTPFRRRKIDNKPTIPPLDCREFLVTVTFESRDILDFWSQVIQTKSLSALPEAF